MRGGRGGKGPVISGGGGGGGIFREVVTPCGIRSLGRLGWRCVAPAIGGLVIRRRRRVAPSVSVSYLGCVIPLVVGFFLGFIIIIAPRITVLILGLVLSAPCVTAGFILRRVTPCVVVLLSVVSPYFAAWVGGRVSPCVAGVRGVSAGCGIAPLYVCGTITPSIFLLLWLRWRRLSSRRVTRRTLTTLTPIPRWRMITLVSLPFLTISRTPPTALPPPTSTLPPPFPNRQHNPLPSRLSPASLRLPSPLFHPRCVRMVNYQLRLRSAAATSAVRDGDVGEQVCGFAELWDTDAHISN